MALAIACGGGDKGGGITGGSGSGPAWDLNKADELAHAALILAGELSGSGWSATDDDFKQDDEPMQASCSDFESFKKEARTSAVVRAKRELEKAGATRDDFGTQVESTVSIYKDNKTASDLVNRYKSFLSNDKFITCFQDEIKSDVGGNATVNIKRVNPSANAPSGGSAAGLDVDVRAGRDQLQAQTENYVWLNGNAVIQINVTATKTSFNADFNKQAVAKQESAANDAVKGTRQRQVSATSTPSRGATPVATSRPGATPSRSPSAPIALASLENTTSHRYNIKIESSGIDFFDMEPTVAGLHREAGTQAPRAGSPIAVEIDGAYSKPDKGRSTFTTGAAKLTMTTIGTQQWIQVGTRTDGPRNVGRQDPEDLSVAIASLSGLTGDPAIMSALKCDSGTTNVNGGAAKRCAFIGSQASRTDLQSFIDGFMEEVRPDLKVNAQDVPTATFEIWSSQPGDFPVKFVFVMEGKETKGTAFKVRMEANVTDINRPVEISAPR
jgi:hypothetical protein